MNAPDPARRLRLACLLAATCLLAASCVLVSACNRTPSAATTAHADKDDDQDQGMQVTLAALERGHAGIVTAPAAALDSEAGVEGFGSVMSHEQIAQAVADSAVADATLRQSQAVLTRMQKLAGTPGADSAEALESAVRQVANDKAAAALALNKASLVLGTQSPWARSNESRVLQALAAGRSQIIRATFPLGALRADPHTLTAAALDAAPQEAPLVSKTVWPAPADPTLPGRSYFALFGTAKFREGERVTVSAPAPAPAGAGAGTGAAGAAGAAGAGGQGAEHTGVFIPAAALLVSQGGYWCYVEHEPGHFTRVPVNISRPRGSGYVVDAGFEAGDAIVIAGAGLLLARETGVAAAGD